MLMRSRIGALTSRARVAVIVVASSTLESCSTGCMMLSIMLWLLLILISHIMLLLLVR